VVARLGCYGRSLAQLRRFEHFYFNYLLLRQPWPLAAHDEVASIAYLLACCTSVSEPTSKPSCWGALYVSLLR